MASQSTDRIHRVAVVQAAPIAFDTARTLAKTADLAADAKRRGTRLALFPEAFVSVYPRGLAFGTVVGSRSAAGREQFRRYWESAIDVPGPDFDALAGIARSNELHLVVGVMERSGGTLYCTVLFFAPDGRCLGKHRKLMPTAAERLIWGSGDGSTLPVLETPVGRVGAVICWENYMPLLRAAMYAKGIQLYCAPTVDDRETWAVTMRHIAIEGRCFVLSAVQYTDGDAPIRGGSIIVGPLGEVLAGPHYDGECILTADLDLGRIAEGKYDLDVVGHYARPDVFRLSVNEEPMAAVETCAGRPMPQ